MPVSTVFENLQSGATVDEIMEWFDVTREQVSAVLEFAARSLDVPDPTAEAHTSSGRARKSVAGFTDDLTRGLPGVVEWE